MTFKCSRRVLTFFEEWQHVQITDSVFRIGHDIIGTSKQKEYGNKNHIKDVSIKY